MTALNELTLLSDLASSQWGLVTATQARQAGVTVQQLARLTSQGALERLRHGVYRLAGAPSDSRTELKAAWLSLAPNLSIDQRLAGSAVAVVSHRSAADLHQLGDLEADAFEFSLPGRKQTRDPQIRLHRRHLTPDQWTVVDGLPVTTVPITIGDLARSGVDGGHLAGVVRDAVTTKHTDVDQVVTVLAPFARRYGAGPGQGDQLLRQLLHQAGVPTNTRRVGELLDAPRLNLTAVQQALADALRPSTTAALQDALAALDTTSLSQAAAEALAPVAANLQQVAAAALAPVAENLQRTLAQQLTSSLTPQRATRPKPRPADPKAAAPTHENHSTQHPANAATGSDNGEPTNA
ncbi:Transcriptional regulator, AbiEi antitoxin, Type IV TA system [Blastococcus aggregatus]|uniref:Transcriptional regulator, AbiEi antitoxin, Type IV TA system n=1 Tax=Blastococcus aggregatus TaxID=38502 RepID=A0A285VJC0_9ACTN|nr:type IV toxin-antitoxin system AbiEi family antitoxin domain-containing protein [Blastococcus aggregatus]SOC53638.1 Transcriptional regulator, AbiEi antitoxin, Type IV TA system [Blastococcus aggregatus]